MEQQIIANGGLQNVPQVAVQYVYLDFDGELTSYNGEILTVDNVEVKDSSLTAERIANILAELNAKYAAQNVIFVTEKPTTAEYSTIFVGKTSAFDQYGSFAGLAETIDEGNKIKNDNAFVMLDSTSSDEAIIATISHETAHLLGTLDHGGNGITAYTAEFVVKAGELCTDAVIESGNQLTVKSGGTAKDITVNEDGIFRFESGASAENILFISEERYRSSGTLFAEFSADDGSKFSGTYRYYDSSSNSQSIDFSLQDNILTNLALGANSVVTVNAGMTVNNLHLVAGGDLIVKSGATLTGDIPNYGSGKYVHMQSGAVLRDAYLENISLSARGTIIKNVETGIYTDIYSNSCTISDSIFGYGGSFSESTIKNSAMVDSYTDFSACTLENVTVGGNVSFYENTYDETGGNGHFIANNKLNGTLTLKADSVRWAGELQANGNTVVLDMTEKTTASEAMIDVDYISDDVSFKILLDTVQKPGRYKLAEGCDIFSDTFSISVGNSDIGILSSERSSISSGIWQYSIVHDSVDDTLDLVIDLSEKLPDGYKVIYIQNNDNLLHSNTMGSLQISEGEELFVKSGGTAKDITVNEDGIFRFESGASAENILFISEERYRSSGTLFAEFSADDGSKFSGTYRYYDSSSNSQSIDFSLQDNILTNLALGANSVVTVNAGMTVNNLHLVAGGDLIVKSGATLTGDIPNYGSGKYVHMQSGAVLRDAYLENISLSARGTIIKNVETGIYTDIYSNSCTISDSIFGYGGSFSESTIKNSAMVDSYTDFSACTLENVTVGGNVSFYENTYDETGGNGHFIANNKLNGTLTLKADSVRWAGELQANGNTVVLDMTEKTTASEAMINSEKLLDAELEVKLDTDIHTGIYSLGTDAVFFAKELWKSVENDCLFQITRDQIYGDIDGKIAIVNEEGQKITSALVNNGSYLHNDLAYEFYIAEDELFFSIQHNDCDLKLADTENEILASKRLLELSGDDFASAAVFNLETDGVDIYVNSKNILQWKVSQQYWGYENNGEFFANNSYTSRKIDAIENNQLDIFFTNSYDKWTANYAAQHSGILNGWSGTNEQVTLSGKNKIADVFSGSDDANILLMTDDTNGDALFVDDIYSALPGTVDAQKARIAQIDEIRAGLGDDIVDMTSQRFEYVGHGVKIYGGLGNDTIWANNGNNTLYGDAGNDRLVGGCDDDIIIGGTGDDSMHGGGGTDTFCFGANWGNDTVEQLADGKVILHFESDSGFWDESTLTYSDGTNSIQVRGVLPEDITLKFGGAAPVAGAFADAVSEKIFEDKNSGMLA